MFDDFQIFLCYVREDEREVEALYQRLTGAGFNVWMDKQHLLPGQTWSDEIEKAIRHSELVIICLSRVWVQKRGFSKREYRLAEDCSKERLEGEIYRIPVRLDDCKIPESLAHIQWVDLFAKDGWKQLVRTIKTALGREHEVLLPRESARPRLLITSPPDEAQVERLHFIEGRVSDPHAAVWLVVHPVDVSGYWVQRSVSVRGSGRWGIEANFGRGSEADVGKHFEVMAVANPEDELREGDVLDGWPASQASSQVVLFTRRAAERRAAPSQPRAPQRLGERSVNTGSVNRSVIITGDNNNVSVGRHPRSRGRKS